MFDEKYMPKFNEFSQRDKLLKTSLISKYIDSSVCFDSNESLPQIDYFDSGTKKIEFQDGLFASSQGRSRNN